MPRRPETPKFPQTGRNAFDKDERFDPALQTCSSAAGQRPSKLSQWISIIVAQKDKRIPALPKRLIVLARKFFGNRPRGSALEHWALVPEVTREPLRRFLDH